ncbi:MAG: PDZ domain-containing protein [Myxococcales bacterium]|nr:PDZ domain-containing protein [Myxococcota bacterium]MDW8281957.1 PDZ domain-containing protein [Myxococcales bacterium]
MRSPLLAMVIATLSYIASGAEGGLPLARASDAATQLPRHRLVGVILSTSQVLLWDEETGEYQLRRVGDEIMGGRIVALEEDMILLERGEEREEIGIMPPPQRRIAARRSRRLPPMIVQVAPVDQEPSAATLAPQAPAQPVPGPMPLPAQPVPGPMPLPIQPQSPPPVPPAPPAAAPQLGPVQALSRAQLERTLEALGGSEPPVALAPHPSGGYRILAVQAGSLAEGMGLRPGDIVLRIDGRPIHSVGDAVSAYAWLRLTDQFTMDVLRDGRLLTLRYVFQP